MSELELETDKEAGFHSMHGGVLLPCICGMWTWTIFSMLSGFFVKATSTNRVPAGDLSRIKRVFDLGARLWISVKL